MAAPPLPEVTSDGWSQATQKQLPIQAGPEKGDTTCMAAQSPQGQSVCQMGVWSRRFFLASTGPCWRLTVSTVWAGLAT